MDPKTWLVIARKERAWLGQRYRVVIGGGNNELIYSGEKLTNRTYAVELAMTTATALGASFVDETTDE